MIRGKNRLVAAILAIMMLLSVFSSGMTASAAPGDPGDPVASAKLYSEKAGYNMWWVRYDIIPAEDNIVTPADVVVILDWSTSMDRPRNVPNEQKRWGIATAGYNDLVNTVMGALDSGVDNKMALVLMGSRGSDDTYVAQKLTNNKNKLLAAVPAAPGSETSFEPAISLAKSQMPATDPDRRHVVIYLTDGSAGEGDPADKAAAVSVVQQWKAQDPSLEFKAVGIGDGHDDTYLKNIVTAAGGNVSQDYVDCSVLSGMQTVINEFGSSLVTSIKNPEVKINVGKGFRVVETQTLTADGYPKPLTIPNPKDNGIDESPYPWTYATVTGLPKDGQKITFKNFPVEKTESSPQPTTSLYALIKYVGTGGGGTGGGGGGGTPPGEIELVVDGDFTYEGGEGKLPPIEVEPDFAEYTITFKVNAEDGTISNPNQFKIYENQTLQSAGKTIPTATHKDSANYEFVGWLQDGETDPSKAKSTDTVKGMYFTDDAEFVAVFKGKDRTLIYDPNGGVFAGKTTTSTEVVEHGKNPQLPDNHSEPTRTGYKFAGWLDQDSVTYGENADITDLKISKDMTFVAQWKANTYTITFKYDGGKDSAGKTQLSVTGAAYDSVLGNKTDQPNTATKSGYVLNGWKDSKGNLYTTTTIKDAVVKGAETYTAQWTANKYNVTFDFDGGNANGTANPQQVEYGKFPVVKNPTKEGSDFVEWEVTLPDGTIVKKSTADLNKLPIEGDTNCKAVWTASKYNVVFNANGGNLNGTVTPQSVEHDKFAVVKAEPTKKGYTFKGWNSSAGGTNIASATINTTAVKGSVTYTAQWEIDKYNVTFDFDGGNANGTATPQQVKYGESPVAKNPTKEGFDFAGWEVTTPDGNKTTIWTDDLNKLPIEGDTNCKAIWATSIHKVDFVANGGNLNGTATPQAVEHNKFAVVKAEPTREGHTFAGWKSSVTNKVIQSVDINKEPVTSAVTYTAQWTINKYNVSFNADIGTLDAAMDLEKNGKTVTYTVNHDGNVIVKDAIPPAGHKFYKWKEVTTGKEYDSDELADTNFQGDMSFIATYTTNAYVVKFELNGGKKLATGMNASYNQAFGTTIDGIADPTPQDQMCFVGWKDQAGVLHTSSALDGMTVHNDATYTAQYKKDENEDKIPDEDQYIYILKFTHGANGSLNGTTEYKLIGGNKTDGSPAPSLSPVPGTLPKGVTFAVPTPKANTGYVPKASWTPALPGTTGNDFVLNGDTTYKIEFVDAAFKVNFDTSAPESDTASHNREVQYNNAIGAVSDPNAKAGKHFSHWVLVGDSTNKKYDSAEIATIIVTSDMTFKAVFDRNKAGVTYVTDGNGTLNGTTEYAGQLEDKIGDLGTIPTPEANPGYAFDHWTVDGYPGGEHSTSQLKDLTLKEESTTIKAVFSKDDNGDKIPDKYQYEYVVTFDAGANGSIASGSQASFTVIGGDKRTSTLPTKFNLTTDAVPNPVAVPNVTVVDGYTKMGWAGTDGVSYTDESAIPALDLLVSQFDAANTYTFTAQYKSSGPSVKYTTPAGACAHPNYTNGSVSLAYLGESKIGIKEYAVSCPAVNFDHKPNIGNNKVDNGTFVVTENGTYDITVHDITGETASASYVVENIDRVAPKLVIDPILDPSADRNDMNNLVFRTVDEVDMVVRPRDVVSNVNESKTMYTLVDQATQMTIRDANWSTVVSNTLPGRKYEIYVYAEDNAGNGIDTTGSNRPEFGAQIPDGPYTNGSSVPPLTASIVGGDAVLSRLQVNGVLSIQVTGTIVTPNDLVYTIQGGTLLTGHANVPLDEGRNTIRLLSTDGFASRNTYTITITQVSTGKVVYEKAFSLK